MSEKNQSIRTTYLTPAFRLSYPNLFEAKLDELSKRMLFSCTMLFPKAATVAQLKATNHAAVPYMAADNCKGFYAEILKVAKANFGPEVDLKSLQLTKFKDGDAAKPKTGKVDETSKGYIVVRTTCKEKPDVRDNQKIRVDDAKQVYAGCWVRAVLTIAPFYNPNRGVTIYLAGIQKICDDTAFSNRPRVDDIFDEVAGETPTTAPAANVAQPAAEPWLN